jgi:hypothetical protein
LEFVQDVFGARDDGRKFLAVFWGGVPGLLTFGKGRATHQPSPAAKLPMSQSFIDDRFCDRRGRHVEAFADLFLEQTE